jgi:MacB-like periplasmic core domain
MRPRIEENLSGRRRISPRSSIYIVLSLSVFPRGLEGIRNFELRSPVSICDGDPVAKQDAKHLTVLGITIGIAAVICVVAIGNAGQARVQQHLNNLGDNFVWIEAGGRAVIHISKQPRMR